MSKVPIRYVPKYLSKKSRKKQIKELKKSRKNYKKGKYYTRKKVKGFKSKRTGWAKKVEDIYSLPKNKAISIAAIQRKTRCKRSALNKIIKKGMGAYYSSGSRPNQTAHSWGKARLYSAVSGGPAARVDMKILEEGCPKNSKALKLAKKAKPIRKTRKTKIGGGKNIMKEKIVKFEKSKRKGKKYMVIVKNKETGKERTLHFGATEYEQFKDSTPLGLYSKVNHGDSKRRKNYFNRHSGTPYKNKAVHKESQEGIYTPKLLSHLYLW